MNYKIMIFCFFIGVILPIIGYLNDMLFGNNNDSEFSEWTLNKLTVKQDSFFRKIMPFKELKGSVYHKYLYIRIIPLIVHILIFLILMPMFIVDQLLVDFMVDDVFGYIGASIIIIFVLYNFILAILAKIL